jgi:hypothetical protein
MFRVFKRSAKVENAMRRLKVGDWWVVIGE